MVLRDFREDDREEFIEMSRIFYHSDAVSHPVPEANFQRTFDEALKGNPFLRGFILEQDGKRAGFGHISFTWSNEMGGMVVWLDELYIRPEYRNLKLGTQFITQVIEQYRSTAKRFRLEVTPENQAARRLYARLGFEDLPYQQMVMDITE